MRLQFHQSEVKPEMAENPLLYSFRRCPYAMRARMSIVRKNFPVELREVILRDRPEHMMEVSPKGTVPILLLEDGTVIEESLEIMQYVSNWELTEEEEYWIKRNDDEFKYHLDRYKYPNRYEGVDETEQRTAAAIYLSDLDKRLETAPQLSVMLNDSLFPFVRQFANHNREWFDVQPWSNIHTWLNKHLESEEFKRCMKKYEQWVEGIEAAFFP